MRVRFMLRQKGVATPVLYCKVFIGAKEARFSLGITLPADAWDAKFSKAKGRAFQHVNEKLVQVEADLNEAKRALEYAGRPVTCQSVKAFFFGELDENLTYIQLHEMYIKDKYVLAKAGKIKTKTAERHEIYACIFADFLKNQRWEELPAEELRPKHLDAFQHWAALERNYKSSYIYKVLQTVLATMRFGLHKEYLHKNLVAGYKQGSPGYRKTLYLTRDEVAKLETVVLTTRTLDTARDVFLLMCYTGFSYADYLAFEESHILERTLPNGQTIKVIHKPRQKSSITSYVPVLPKLQRILDKYGRLQPTKVVLQSLNRSLLLVGDEAGIGKRLSTRVARKTCAMLLRDAGVSKEIAQMWLGHASVRTTEKHYMEDNDSPILRYVSGGDGVISPF